ncbi:MAG: glycosyltransferase family 2 protein [Bacteroidales bacterium]|nr:glycosyltransferase family 2 protein [Bacteroidales bacterium]
MGKLLTIVIPTYNMQDYLNRCLESLVVSPELMQQLEVLVINDGSKDNSSAIAHGYEAKYPNTFCVIDKENGNYGSCVNKGLAEAKGKYIKILDADDWFDTGEFENYLRALAIVEVDLALTPYNFIENSTHCVRRETLELPIGEIFDFNTYSSEKITYYPMHMVTYRTAMLKGIDYFQTEGISYTDNEWTFIPMYSIRKFVYFPFVVYQYLIGRIGQTMDSDMIVRNAWHLEPICKALIENRAKFVLENVGLAEKLNRSHIEMTVARLYKLVLIKMNPSIEDLERLQEFDDYIKEKCPTAHEYVSKSVIKSWFPVHYVKYWRRTGRRLPISWFREGYRRIRYGHQ